MFDFKNKFNLKKTLITTIFLLFVFSLSGGLVYFVNASKNQVQPISNIEEKVEPVSTESKIDNSGLVLNWNKYEDEKVIKPLALSNDTTTVTTTSEGSLLRGYTITYDNSLSSLSGGTTVEISDSSETKVTLAFKNKSGQAIGEAVFETNGRFRLHAIYFGTANDGTATQFIYDVYNKKLKDGNGNEVESGSVTTEEIDPFYTENLFFWAEATELIGSINFYYKIGDAQDWSTKSVSKRDDRFNSTYVINTADDKTTTVTEKNEVTIKVGDNTYENITWWVRYDYMVDEYNCSAGDYDKTNNLRYYKYVDESSLSAKSCLYFIYDSNEGVGVRENNKTVIYYPLIKITGYGKFWQSDDKPAIFTNLNSPVQVTVENKNSYWEDLSESELYGVVDSEGNVSDDNSVEFKLTADDDYIFMISNGTSFYKNDSDYTSIIAESNYAVYNYGFKLKGYIVLYENPSLSQYITLNNETWGKSDNPTEISTENLIKENGKVLEMAEIIFYLQGEKGTEDFNWLCGIYQSHNLTLTPVWEAESIVVKDSEGNVIVDSDKDGDADADGKISFASEYSLTKLESTSFVCYKIYEQYIASDAIWNYKDIIVSQNGYVYDTTNKFYTLTVEAVYLDNIYRVDLLGLLEGLSSDSYAFVEETPTVTDYIVGGEVTNLTQWNSSTYPLVDVYIEDLKSEISEANESVGGSSNLTKKIFNDGSKNFIYLADNAGISDLLLAHNNAQTIAWKNKNNSTAFTTSAYVSKFSNELEDAKNSTSTKWTYSENNTELTAVYVYGLDLYYVDNNSSYSSMQAQWYGASPESKLTIDKIPTDIPQGKAFVSWMLNKSNAEAQGYVVSASGTTLTLTKDQKTTTFTFEDSSGNYYYGISAVYGNDVFNQTSENPIIVARYSGNTYQVTIDNSSTYWNSETLGTQDESNLYGAVSSSEINGSSDNNFKTTTFQIADTENGTSAYPFQTNNGKAFLKLEDIYKDDELNEDNIDTEFEEDSILYFYFVYNYGYEISGWKVQATLNGTITKFKFNGTNWSKWETGSDVSTNLSSETLQSLANYLDSYYPSENDEITVKLTPVWEEASVDVYNGTTKLDKKKLDGTEGDPKYSEGYTLDQIDYSDDSKTLFAYQDTDNNLIALSGVWNYYENIKSERYVYGSGIYKISVTPLYVDNIFKVSLGGVLSSTKPELEKTDYAYATDKYEFANYNFKTYTGNSYAYKSYKDYSGTKNLIDYYIEVLNGYFEDWNEGIDGDFTSILKKVQYDSSKNELWIYLVDSRSVGQLPMFKHDYAQIIAWDYGSPITKTYKTNGFENDGDGNDNYDIFDGELVEDRVEVEGGWSYSENLLTAHYVYRLDLYYEDNDSSNGVYSKKQAEWYGANTDLDISVDKYKVTDEDGAPSKKEFDSWMVVVANAVNSGYAVSPNTTNKIITLTKTGVEFSFKYENSFKVSESSDVLYYYGISKVKGNAILDQNSSTPIVLAKYNSEYALTVDNTGDISSVYWKDKDTTNSNLYGAVSSNELNETDDNNFKITSFIISNNEDCAYPFQTNAGLAFYKLEDLIKANNELNVDINSKLSNNDFYFVYNYGHEISGWKVIGKHYDAEEEKYVETLFVFNGTSWHVSAGDTEKIKLLGQTLQTMSAYLDGYYGTTTGEITVTLAPTWQAASIDIVTTVKNNEDWNVKSDVAYAGTYSGLTYRDSSTGQSLFAYRLASDASNVEDYQLIALSGVWNYRNFSYENYPYENEEYIFRVDPVFVDNIYKVMLQNVKPNQFNVDSTKDEYALDSNCDYVFNSETGTYDVGNKYVFKYSDYAVVEGSDYVYKSYSNETLVDSYIDNLKVYLANWIEGISDAENLFEILRKVYYSDGELKDGKLIADLSSSDDYLCVYLANNQKTGKLPAFDKDDYVHILWKNTVSVQSKNYIYLTNKYENDLHSGEIKAEYCWHGENLEVDSIWNYSDGFDAKDGNIPKFEAKYFRGYIQVEISTLFDSQLTNGIEENIARRGYVLVNITDNLYADDNTIVNMGGNFIVIAEQVVGTNDYNMKVYQIVKNETFTSILNYWDSTNNTMLISNDSLVNVSSILPLYTGCSISINVKDQSKDSTAMASGEFDEMIGYKYKETIQRENPIFETFDSDSYTHSETDENILKNYGYYFRTNETVKIDVYFTEILYNITYGIDNVSSGKFNIRANQYHATNTERVYLVENIKVGGLYQVEYFANAGYKLKNEAFTLVNRVKIEPYAIQTYDESGYQTSVEAGTPNEALISQIYTLTTGMNSGNYFDAGWLRTYFYSDKNYDVNLIDLGTITINTDVIEFNYGVKVYDSYSKTTIETKENKGTIRLDLVKGTAQFASVKGILGAEINNNIVNGETFWHYTSSNTNYALISSRMYFPNSMMLESSDNYWQPYSFLLLDEPNREYTLSSSHLARMVGTYDSGKIISNLNNNRNIYLMIEVRELIKLDLKVKYDALDSNDTTRTVIISNGTKNSKSLILNENEGYTGRYFDKTLTLTSYKGLENYLNSDYTENRYTGVKYYLGSDQNPIQDNMFITDSNKEVIVEFSPIALQVQYSYYLDGEIKDYADVATYISETKKPLLTDKFALNHNIEYSVNILNDDYNLRVFINNNLMGTTSISTRSISCEYEVIRSDFDKNGITIRVEIFELDTTQISIRYQLFDLSKLTATENYGTFSVYSKYLENPDEKLAEDVSSSTNVSVAEKRNVIIELTNIPTGYVFKGYKHNTFAPVMVELSEDDDFILIKEFNPSKDSGDYVILLDKEKVTASLNTSQDQIDYYKINGTNYLSNLYVGSVVNFTSVEVNTERLDYFYFEAYDKSSGTSVKKQEKITENSFTITSEVLESLEVKNTINFKVAVIKRYKLDLIIRGGQYLANDGFITVFEGTETEYVLGSYVDSGTKITFKITPETIGKYDVKYDGVADEDDEIKINEHVIELKQDHSHIIEISPKIYSVNVEEYIYEKLADVDSGTPKKVNSENHVNGLDSSEKTQTYNINAILKFTKVTSDRELSKITISNNDMDKTIIITFDGDNYVVTVDGDEVDLTDYGYTIAIVDQGLNIRLSYITYNNISINLEYKDYKIIEA